MSSRHRHRSAVRRERAAELDRLRAWWHGPRDVPFDAPPRDDRSHDTVAERTGLEWSTDGTRWRFDTVDERRRFVADAHDRARLAGAATSVLQTLRNPL